MILCKYLKKALQLILIFLMPFASQAYEVQTNSSDNIIFVLLNNPIENGSLSSITLISQNPSFITTSDTYFTPIQIPAGKSDIIGLSFDVAAYAPAGISDDLTLTVQGIISGQLVEFDIDIPITTVSTAPEAQGYVGFGVPSSSLGDADNDGDGVSNIVELAYGSDPNDIDSIPGIIDENIPAFGVFGYSLLAILIATITSLKNKLGLNKISFKRFLLFLIFLLPAFYLFANNSTRIQLIHDVPVVVPVVLDEGPVITLNGKPSIQVAFNAFFDDIGAQAVDDVDGEVPVVVEGVIDTSVPGTYQLTYIAADSSGNTSELVREVEVLSDPLLEASVSMPAPPISFVFDGELIGADYWSQEPQILSAGVGFSDILGVEVVEVTEDLARDVGGAWSSDISCGSGTGNYTTVATQDQLSMAYIQQVPYGELKDGALGIDGLPIVFSWPIDTRTISLTDFQFTLNNGDIVRPLAASPLPNHEDNERNTVVVFGEFANRLPSDDANARYPIRLRIVQDNTPLLLVGPNNQLVSAVGMTWETSSSPYDENNGPRLVGAKLNRLEGPMRGESVSGIPNPFIRQIAFPANDASVLYSEGDFMLRMLTSGGFSPDGVSGVKPTDYERFFRIHAMGEEGNSVIIDKLNQDFNVKGGTLRVVGLSDLGQPEGGGVAFDECYREDRDNYIDIILVGDEDAARSITHLEIPSLNGGYSAFYNPGGPGRTPFEGVTYTSPGPADLEPVIIALDDPMRIDYTPTISN